MSEPNADTLNPTYRESLVGMFKYGYHKEVGVSIAHEDTLNRLAILFEALGKPIIHTESKGRVKSLELIWIVE